MTILKPRMSPDIVDTKEPTPKSSLPVHDTDANSIAVRNGPDKRVKALQRFAASITIFTIAGHLFLGFEQAPITPVVVALWAYCLELLLETVASAAYRTTPRYRGGPRAFITFLLPTQIAAMATAMLLYGNSSLWPYLFAVSVAISVKYVIKSPIGGRWRHTMNPSNTGIALVLLIFPWVGIAPPYMFTSSVTNPWDWLVPLAVLFLGTALNAKLTGKIPLILGWIGGFVLQAILRSILGDASLLAALAPMTGVAFILFTNYMITDPGSTPIKTRNQVIFGLSCAVVYGLLVALHVAFGLFFALFIVCLGRTILLHGMNAVDVARKHRLLQTSRGSES